MVATPRTGNCSPKAEARGSNPFGCANLLKHLPILKIAMRRWAPDRRGAAAT